VQFWESNKLPDSAKAVLVATCTLAAASQVHLSEQQFALIARAGGFGRQHLLYPVEDRSSAHGKQQTGGALGTRISSSGKFGYPKILRA
jgi:hypothetical protein